jgi:hypothetical protein
MSILRSLPIALFLVISIVRADELSEFQNNVEIRLSKMMADANQHARCFVLASTSRDTLIAKLHYAHGTYVLEQEYFDAIAKEETEKLTSLKLPKKELEYFAYNRYNGNCKHLHLGRPQN